MSRYSRHIVLNEIGPAGQEKISRAKVLVIGAGGLGCGRAVNLDDHDAGCGLAAVRFRDDLRLQPGADLFYWSVQR